MQYLKMCKWLTEPRFETATEELVWRIRSHRVMRHDGWS